ncbi:unnamed protein product [Cylicocyclus nassatus]|uniref:SCP domain-containing protein n=1 Tax=Cylicocyclus nassatus TaxID=53992 RepID=A0AA36GHI5_CYLNA|nr:unnamed protein product [Cylicocyclus nassatus]
MLVDIVICIFLTSVGLADATHDYQCWNPKSTDEYRQKFLTQINSRRKDIADGKAENRYGLLPKGKNIYMLYYWCDLELLAQEVADKCDVSARAPVGYSKVIARFSPSASNTMGLADKSIKQWWDEISKIININSTIIATEDSKAFATLANGKARKLGCAQNLCGEDFYAVCVLDAKTPAIGEQIYEIGTGCTTDAECTTFTGSTCDVDINQCVGGLPGSYEEEEEPAFATASPSATTCWTTTPKTTTTTELRTIDPAFNKRCPNNQVIDDFVRSAFLLNHNALREQLAQGLVVMGNGVMARKASRMIRLVYDCDAEKSAHDWASKCIDEDSTQTMYTENRYTINDTSVTVQAAAYKSVWIWWEEIKNKNMLQLAGQTNLYYNHLGLKHFAKMAWDTQKKIGCSVVTCPSFVNVVCHYSGANVGEGLQIYKMGPSCARCSEQGTTTCVSGLCELEGTSSFHTYI